MSLSGETLMSAWIKKVEDWFAAVAFAEAGEHDTARELAGLGARPAGRKVGILETFNTFAAAAAFAEENCLEIAREILDATPRRRSFLEDVGLAGVRVWYGTVPTEPLSFLEEVGLAAVRVRYVTVSL